MEEDDVEDADDDDDGAPPDILKPRVVPLNYPSRAVEASVSALATCAALAPSQMRPLFSQMCRDLTRILYNRS